MSIRFEWDDSFSVANEKIDQQHKMLFELANSIRDDLNQPGIKKIIMDLYQYTREHFTAEEQMMQRISYPKLEEHKELHGDLITKLNTLSAQSFEDDESVNNFITFVYDWLTHHILNRDMDYMRFAHDKK
ncbi:MAG: hemerythrin family protein [Desulfobacula sp.]|nr:hemerythrin family protein [Desulfobacula sp.]